MTAHSVTVHGAGHGFVPSSGLRRLLPPRRCPHIPVPAPPCARPWPRSPSPRLPIHATPQHRSRTHVLASAPRASLRLCPTHLSSRQFSRFNAPVFLHPRPALSLPPTVVSRRPCPHTHVPEPRGDVTTATAVKWPRCGPRRTRPCARSSPGQAPGWSIVTIAVPLQALEAIREEEVGRVLSRRRVVGFALYFRAENRPGTKLRRYPSGLRVRKRARRNSAGQGVGSAPRARWGHSGSGVGVIAVVRWGVRMGHGQNLMPSPKK